MGGLLECLLSVRCPPDLWEVRVNIPGGIARVLFTVDKDLMILLNGFIKKSQKTPENELETAKKRLNQYRGVK